MAKAPKTGRDALPKRFAPLFDQAQTETALRYGSQESALSQILAQVTRDYARQAEAQKTAGQSVLGAYKGADQQLQNVYNDAGLTPEARAQLGNSPTGARLAGELASGRAGIQSQVLGQQAGNQYLQQHIADKYSEDVGQVGQQIQALSKEKGLYQSSLLDQLIGSDRSARHDANEAARKQAHEDQQAILDRASATGNALIGQGLAPVINEDGSVTVGPALPGGKADPNAPGNKPKRTSGPGTASPDAQKSAGTAFTKALALANGMARGKSTPEVRQTISGTLASGKPATSGKVIYEEVPVLGPNGQKTGKTKRQPKLEPAKLPDGSPNPRAGQQMVSPSRPAIPGFDQPIAEAAAEQATYGYVTTATVQKLHKLGYSVNQIPGLKTENQARASRPKDTRDYARPGTAPSRDQQPG